MKLYFYGILKIILPRFWIKYNSCVGREEDLGTFLDYVIYGVARFTY